MYLLDTNVICELRKKKSGKADKKVIAWEESVVATSLFLSAITIFELETGVLLKERGEPLRGKVLRSWLTQQVLPNFARRILPFDAIIAQHCAKLHIPDRRSESDAMIAATALVHKMIVVTRNEGDFKPTGVPILNPWE